MFEIEQWVFWILFYWFGLWALFLDWYVKNGKKSISRLELFFTLLLIGFLTPIFLMCLVIKAVIKTKR